MRPLRPFRLAAALAAPILAAGLIATPTAQAEPRDYVMDEDHFAIVFMVHHLGLADTVGMFREARGSFTFDEETGELSDVEIVVRTDSVFTNHEARDKHLRNADFLNAGEYPTMTFTADKAVRTGENTAEVPGELTLLGVTKPLTLDVTFNGSRDYPFGDGHHAIGLSARGTITRSDHGMTYATQNDIVGDEIDLIIEFEAMYADAGEE
jgi:polyisoprenoid-binding protein YceI